MHAHVATLFWQGAMRIHRLCAGAFAAAFLFISQALPAAAQTGPTWTACARAAVQPDAAIAACRKLIGSGRETPRNTAIAHHNAAVALAAKRDFRQAIADLDQALRLDPRYMAAYTRRGLAYEAIGEDGQAVQDYGAALRAGAPKSFEERQAQRIANERISALPPGPSRRPPAVATATPPAPTAVIAAAPPAVPPGPPTAVATPTPSVLPPAPTAVIAAAPPVLPPDPPTAVATPSPSVSPPLVASRLPEAAASVAPPSALGRRIALVIGNAKYRSVPALPNPGRDADALASTLRGLGFQKVTLETDLTRERLVDALRTFAAEAERADWALVYFAGHGIELGGTNYLVPIEAKLTTDRDIEFEAVSLDMVVNAVDGAKRLRLVLLDACRDNPFVSQMRRSMATRSIGRGLARVEPDAGIMVVYAARHGQVALDGDGGNSPFTAALLNRMKSPGLEVRRLFDLVRDDVMSATNRRQQPFSYGSVPGSEEFFFVAAK
jgi:tetratricopeptide (TPR) repeat protein